MSLQSPIEQGKTGIYTLIIALDQEIEIAIGKLGVYKFPKGVYTYTGSALGRGSTDLRGRLLRHISKTKRHHWHIDYFLSIRKSQVRHIIFFETSERGECTIVKKLISLGGEVIVNGFGASDCTSGCGSHLLLFEDNFQSVLKTVKKAYEIITTGTTIRELSFG
jgi:Uri superfamily endonuclease